MDLKLISIDSLSPAHFLFAENALVFKLDTNAAATITGVSQLQLSTLPADPVALALSSAELCASSPSELKVTLPVALHQTMINLMVANGPNGPSNSTIKLPALAFVLSQSGLYPGNDMQIPLSFNGMISQALHGLGYPYAG